MEIDIRLYGRFASYAPKNQPEFSLKLAPGATAQDVLALLKIPLDQDRVLLVNGRRSELEKGLQQGDTVVLFPSLTGG